MKVSKYTVTWFAFLTADLWGLSKDKQGAGDHTLSSTDLMVIAYSFGYWKYRLSPWENIIVLTNQLTFGSFINNSDKPN